MRNFHTAVLLLTSLLAASANAAGRGGPILSPGNHTITLSSGSRERSAIVHVPPRAVEMRAIPVVLNFHGGGGHAENEQEYSLMDRVADRETFVAIYPNGTGLFGKQFLTWNAGTCCAYAVINKVDDVGFIRALVADLAQRIPIDRSRVYATGLSNGGMMAHRLAAEAPDLVTCRSTDCRWYGDTAEAIVSHRSRHAHS